MKKYNTAINPLGGIADLNIIIETIRFYLQEGDLEKTREEFVEGNTFGFNIRSSSKRFFSVIKKIFINDPDNKANQFFMNSIASLNSDNSFKKAALFIETCRKNDLFHDITLELLAKKYHENRRLITRDEIYDFLMDYGQGTKITEWSDSTIKTICSKYISFMKRLGYFVKDEGYKSMFNFPQPNPAITTYLVYLLDAMGKVNKQIFNSDLFEALMIDVDQKIELLKKGSMAGYYDFKLSGSGNAIFNLNYSHEEIIDELFK